MQRFDLLRYMWLKNFQNTFIIIQIRSLFKYPITSAESTLCEDTLRLSSEVFKTILSVFQFALKIFDHHENCIVGIKLTKKNSRMLRLAIIFLMHYILDKLIMFCNEMSSLIFIRTYSLVGNMEDKHRRVVLDYKEWDTVEVGRYYFDSPSQFDSRDNRCKERHRRQEQEQPPNQ